MKFPGWVVKARLVLDPPHRIPCLVVCCEDPDQFRIFLVILTISVEDQVDEFVALDRFFDLIAN